MSPFPDNSQPFLLIDDARPGGEGARLYSGCRDILVANHRDEVPSVLDGLAGLARRDLHAGGFLAYEAGAAMESALSMLPDQMTDAPLAWFGGFETCERINGAALEAMLPDPAGAWIGAPRPLIGFDEYRRQFEIVQRKIAAGDLYQVNLTFPAEISIAGSPLAIFAALRHRAQAGYGALLWTGELWILSLSPELFFDRTGNRIRARPMKGTAPRDSDPAIDRAAAETLASDAKQRAENLMIVDLMRNDLSRVAVAGSVRVPDLFKVEQYPTVHQMVSDIQAELKPDVTPADVLKAIFPCGSITGAPKIAAMRAISEIEVAPRGIYTGAIGNIAPNGDAQFNVAIRTLTLAPNTGKAMIGLGSGIVADSDCADEFEECLTKSAFLTRGQRAFDLIETMAFEPETGISLLERHLARMKASAAQFGFSFDRHVARNELQAATFRLNKASRIRLLLSPSGAIAIESGPMPPVPNQPVEVAIVPIPVDVDDFRLMYKTSNRRFYDEARRRCGCFEILFERPDGRLTEGSFTNLFVDDGQNVLRTPPAADGLLSGVLRDESIEQGRAIESPLTRGDLAQGFYVGNALRGLIRAQLVAESNSGG